MEFTSQDYRNFELALHDGKAGTVAHYIKDGIDVNHIFQPETTRNTPLIIASLNNHLGVVKHLLNSDKIKVNMQNKGGDSALIWAAIHGSSPEGLEILKLLLGKGANPNLVTKSKRVSPLLYAVQYKAADAVKFLLLAGADINHVDADEDSVFTIQTSNEVKQVLQNWIKDDEI